MMVPDIAAYDIGMKENLISLRLYYISQQYKVFSSLCIVCSFKIEKSLFAILSK